MVVKNSITDELVNKLYHLTKAYEQAKDIIKVLEEENHFLQETIKEYQLSHDVELV